MAPLPKRKHSTQRKGKRLKTRNIFFRKLVVCPNCKKMKLPHRVCKHCGK
ncbi:50S ribosomal protein L32 [Candidatus Roizmanbacteria bacterium]|nr:50S ribosomal protein L32 [Candidatus Roizmanbacteria bacterium]